MDSKLIYIAGIAVAAYLLLRKQKIKLLSVNQLDKTVTVEYKRKKFVFTYRYSDEIFPLVNNESLVFTTNGPLVDVHALNDKGEANDYLQIDTRILN